MWRALATVLHGDRALAAPKAFRVAAAGVTGLYSRRASPGLTMTTEDTKIVRVRLNVSGKRLIGYVPLPPGEFSRFSDVLNSAEPYILIRDQEQAPEPGQGTSRAILKDSIS
jgi:hypothetical protein